MSALFRRNVVTFFPHGRGIVHTRLPGRTTAAPRLCCRNQIHFGIKPLQGPERSGLIQAIVHAGNQDGSKVTNRPAGFGSTPAPL